MKLHKQVLMNTVALGLMIALSLALSPAQAEEKQWVLFHENIPQDSKRIPVKLEFAPSTSPFFHTSQSINKSEKLQDDNDGYQQQLDFGTGIDGRRYVVMVKDASDMNIITENPERLSMAKVLRGNDNTKMETVIEGLILLNREIVISFELTPETILVPMKEPVRGSIRIGVFGNNYPAYGGQCQTILSGSLSGSTSIEAAFLHASITCGDTLELKSRNLTVTVKPFADKMASVSSTGKLTDPLTLGSAKLVVEKIASDSSELVLAVLDGQLVQERQQDAAFPVVGRPFPAFTRVELFRHELVTLGNLQEQAGQEGYVVLIFGDFKTTLPPYYGGQPPLRTLSLDERMISDMVKKDCEKSVVIGFICQQFSLGCLYEKWLGQEPDFHVLSDFSNPLDTQFIGARMEPGAYRPDERGETLRRNLRLENQKVVTALIDGNGGLVYLNPDAGGELSKSLVEINTLMREGRTTDKQE